MKGNIRSQTFVVTIETKVRDGCGESIRPLTEGEVRRALAESLDRYDSIISPLDTHKGNMI